MPRLLMLSLFLFIVSAPRAGRAQDKKPEPFTVPLTVGSTWTGTPAACAPSSMRTRPPSPATNRAATPRRPAGRSCHATGAENVARPAFAVQRDVGLREVEGGADLAGVEPANAEQVPPPPRHLPEPRVGHLTPP